MAMAAWDVGVEMRGVHEDISEGRARRLSGANEQKQGCEHGGFGCVGLREKERVGARGFVGSHEVRVAGLVSREWWGRYKGVGVAGTFVGGCAGGEHECARS